MILGGGIVVDRFVVEGGEQVCALKVGTRPHFISVMRED